MKKIDKATDPADKRLTDARVLRSRAALVQAGRVLLNKNYESSMSDIAHSAGVGRATLYRAFETKEDLVIAIALDCLQSFDRVTEHIEKEAGSALEAVRLLYESIIPLNEEMQFIMDIGTYALEDSEVLSLRQSQQDDMQALVEWARSEGAIDKSLPSAWVINVMDALLYAAWMMKKEQSYSDKEIVDLAFQAFCSGVSAS